MDWCSIYLTPQALSEYIYLSPPLIFPTTSTELGQKTARYESLRALLHYVEWDRIVTLAGSKSGLRVTLSYLSPLPLPLFLLKIKWLFPLCKNNFLAIVIIFSPCHYYLNVNFWHFNLSQQLKRKLPWKLIGVCLLTRFIYVLCRSEMDFYIEHNLTKSS